MHLYYLNSLRPPSSSLPSFLHSGSLTLSEFCAFVRRLPLEVKAQAEKKAEAAASASMGTQVVMNLEKPLDMTVNQGGSL
jgi:hypothetical protein